MNEALAAARLWLYRRRPFLAVGLWSLTPVRSDRVKGLGVDAGFNLYYNPGFCDQAPVEVLGLCLYHLLMHLAAGHPERAEALGAEPRRWNLATDLAANSGLEEEGLSLPRDWPRPWHLGLPAGLTAEEYYERLPNRQAETGGCGGVLAGRTQSGLSAAEARAILERLATEVRRARGTIPGWWRRWAEGAAKGRIDWARELRAAVAEAAGESDFSYRRLSRRTRREPELILPGLVDPIPEVAIVVDTSASVGEDLLSRMVAEVAGVLRALGYREVMVLAVDAAVRAVSRTFAAERVRLVWGGGTDMGAGLAAALRLRPRPQVVVVLTDGQTPWPTAWPRGFRVVVCLFGSRAWPVPDWARGCWLMGGGLVFEPGEAVEVELEEWRLSRERLGEVRLEPGDRLWGLSFCYRTSGLQFFGLLAEPGVLVELLAALEGGQPFEGPIVVPGGEARLRVVLLGEGVRLEIRSRYGFRRCDLPAGLAVELGRLRGRVVARLFGDLIGPDADLATGSGF